MKITLKTIISLTTLLLSSTTLAQNQINTHWNLTAIHQQSNLQKIDKSQSLSLDFTTEYLVENGQWNLHIEANNSLSNKSVANVIESSNSDANNAINTTGNGRLQISELNYQLNLSNTQTVTFGLINSGGFLDTSNIANDENTQFLNATLVNNPLIDLPDYSIAAVAEFKSDFDWTFLISSTHGIADNPNRNYSELFEMGADDKGLFMAIETFISTLPWSNTQLKLGSWVHTGEHESLSDSTNTDNKNFGVYTTVMHQHDKHQFEVKAAMTNPEVSIAHRFLSIAHQYNWKNSLYSGLGYSLTNYSPKANVNSSNTQVMEAYLAYQMTEGLTLSPSIQWIENPQYSEVSIDDKIASIINLRINYQI